MKKASYSVEGMTCASCAMTVEKAVGKLTGVEQVGVNIATEKLTLTYDAELLSFEDISQTVEKAGYRLVDNLVTETYLIEGMTCASCAMMVEKTLRKLEGVEEVNVHLVTEKVRIRYDRDRQNLASLEATVKKAGYKLVWQASEREKEMKKKADQARNSVESIYLVSLIYSSFTLYIYGTYVAVWWTSFANLAPSAFILYHQSIDLAFASPLYRSQFFQKRL